MIIIQGKAFILQNILQFYLQKTYFADRIIWAIEELLTARVQIYE